MIQIFHNSRCGKSRECLVYLENSGQKFEIIKYLEEVPTFEELENIIEIKPIELVRTKEKIWIEKFKNKPLTDNEIIQAMISNPILIERPIVINGNKGVIARPLEKAASVL
jgi:arsenate reductase (glutaredoxin)